MNRVFITNDTGLDFRRASLYGELRTVTKGPVDPFAPDRSRLEVAKGLEGFTPRDYLLLTGSVLATALAVVVLREQGHKQVQLLLYDSKKRDYFSRTIPL